MRWMEERPLFAAQSQVPMPPPGMQTAMATEHHELSPQLARSLQPEMDAANAETPQAEIANIDEKIADVEAKLNHTIGKLNADMDGKLAQMNERLHVRSSCPQCGTSGH